MTFATKYLLLVLIVYTASLLAPPPPVVFLDEPTFAQKARWCLEAPIPCCPDEKTAKDICWGPEDLESEENLRVHQALYLEEVQHNRDRSVKGGIVAAIGAIAYTSQWTADLFSLSLYAAGTYECSAGCFSCANATKNAGLAYLFANAARDDRLAKEHINKEKNQYRPTHLKNE